MNLLMPALIVLLVCILIILLINIVGRTLQWLSRSFTASVSSDTPTYRRSCYFCKHNKLACAAMSAQCGCALWEKADGS